MSSAMKAGDRVLVAPGYYRVGKTANSHLSLPRHTLGTVEVIYEHGLRANGSYQDDPTKVLVYLDNDELPNPYAPATAMVDVGSLEVVVLV